MATTTQATTAPTQSVKPSLVERQLKYLVFAYIFLLIFEGALRKWALPQLSEVLLLVRDPIVLISYVLALIHHKFPINRYVVSGGILVLLCSVLAMLIGHGNLFVTLFGIRTNFLHIPFAFIIGNVLNRNDVVKFGNWWLWGTVGMTVLIVLQFYSPQSAWVNRSVGGGEGGGFSGAIGRYRPPATFSFIVGTVQFYTISTAFLIAGLMQHKYYSKFLLALASGAMLIAIPVSISRSLILSCAIVVLTGLFASGLQKGTMIRIVRITLIGCIALFFVAQIPIFDDAREAFMARWENSTGEKTGGFQTAIAGRLIEMFTGPFKNTEDLPLFGKGIGAGTQVGAKLLTGEKGFSLGESEWYRLFGEYGLILGLLFIIWRISLCFKLFTLSLKSLTRGNGMGLIFLSATALNLITGQLGQTTIHGFTMIGIGLTIASMRLPKTRPQTNDKQKNA
jgi:hypothetical protein